MVFYPARPRCLHIVHTDLEDAIANLGGRRDGVGRLGVGGQEGECDLGYIGGGLQEMCGEWGGGGVYKEILWV